MGNLRKGGGGGGWSRKGACGSPYQLCSYYICKYEFNRVELKIVEFIKKNFQTWFFR